MISYRLYTITDRTWLREGESLASAVEAAIIGGATFIQLREKHLAGDELKALALSVQEVCKHYNVPFVINDDVELALEIDADGVHVGQSDMAVITAREILGPDKIIGATAKTVEQAIKAEKQGADYLGSGAIFGTTTKSDAKPMSKELLAEICDSVSIPVVAIGGIDDGNVNELSDMYIPSCNSSIQDSNVETIDTASISGVAVVSGIFAQPDITRACHNIVNNLCNRPIIQCFNNHVTVNQVANMVLTCDASPIMAHNINEVSEVQEFASALLVNLGATDDYEAIRVAYKHALELGHVIVIDPVGVSGIKYRRDFLTSLLELGSPTCIRGNRAEITAIYNGDNTSAGLDGNVSSNHNVSSYSDGTINASIDELTENVNSIEEICCSLANRLNCVIVASGEYDIITDGSNLIKLDTGHKMQRKLTGSGCMLSGAICSFLSFMNETTNKPLATAIAANTCQRLGDAAYRAAESTLAENKGILTYQTKWFDELF